MTTSDAVIRPRWGLFVSMTPTGGSLESARPRLFSGAPSGLGCAGSNHRIYCGNSKIFPLWARIGRVDEGLIDFAVFAVSY